MSSSIRNFVVVFLLFLLIFGICGHFIATTIVPGLIGNDESKDIALDNKGDDGVIDTSVDDGGITPNTSSDNSNIDNEINMDDYTYNFAFLCLDLDEELAGLYVVHVNNYYKSTVTTFMPGSATTEIGGSSLSQLYKYKGKEFLLEKLFYLTDLKIDDYCSLYSFDKNGGGKSISMLSSYLEYKYRVNTPFDYPNPDYTPEFPDTDLESGESQETSENESGDADTPGIENEEFITIPVGSYSLNDLTDGYHNYKLLLDSKYNPKVDAIFSELFSRFLIDKNVMKDTAKAMKFFTDSSYGTYTEDSDVAQIFNTYKKSDFVTIGGGINDWDETKEYFQTLEKIS